MYPEICQWERLQELSGLNTISVILQCDSKLNFDVKLLIFCVWHLLPGHISIFNSETNMTDATFHITTFFSSSEEKNVRSELIDIEKT
jgi:hypothetical protein